MWPFRKKSECEKKGHNYHFALLESDSEGRRVPAHICSRCFNLQLLPREINLDRWERYHKDIDFTKLKFK